MKTNKYLFMMTFATVLICGAVEGMGVPKDSATVPEPDEKRSSRKLTSIYPEMSRQIKEMSEKRDLDSRIYEPVRTWALGGRMSSQTEKVFKGFSEKLENDNNFKEKMLAKICLEKRDLDSRIYETVRAWAPGMSSQTMWEKKFRERSKEDNVFGQRASSCEDKDVELPLTRSRGSGICSDRVFFQGEQRNSVEIKFRKGKVVLHKINSISYGEMLALLESANKIYLNCEDEPVYVTNLILASLVLKDEAEIFIILEEQNIKAFNVFLENNREKIVTISLLIKGGYDLMPSVAKNLKKLSTRYSINLMVTQCLFNAWRQQHNVNAANLKKRLESDGKDATLRLVKKDNGIATCGGPASIDERTGTMLIGYDPKF